jgi:hypothetical protein
MSFSLVATIKHGTWQTVKRYLYNNPFDRRGAFGLYIGQRDRPAQETLAVA